MAIFYNNSQLDKIDFITLADETYFQLSNVDKNIRIEYIPQLESEEYKENFGPRRGK